MIRPAAAKRDAANAAQLLEQGRKVLVLLVAWVVQLVAYFLVTCIVIRCPDQADAIAVLFVFAEELLLMYSGEIPSWLFGDSDRVTAGQKQAAHLMRFAFLTLHGG